MSTKNILILVILGIIVLFGVYYFGPKESAVPQVFDSENPEIQNTSPYKTYKSDEHGISFEYSSKYLLAERDSGTEQFPQKSIILVEDTEQNRNILSGKSAEVGEGPTAITIDILPNPNSMTPENWVSENTNWIMRDKPQESISIGGRDGFTYYWDGLYAGKSSVITDSSNAYIFSVTWITENDKIISDQSYILSSFKFIK